jgi:hypothetical protein
MGFGWVERGAKIQKPAGEGWLFAGVFLCGACLGALDWRENDRRGEKGSPLHSEWAFAKKSSTSSIVMSARRAARSLV